MKAKLKTRTINYRVTGLYVLLPLIGVSILAVVFMLTKHPHPDKGEYFYSRSLSESLTLPAKAAFIIVAFLVTYYLRLHPLLVGVLLFLAFPLTSVVEGVMYKGSHNLLPFEFIMHFIFAIPAIVAAYIGRFLSERSIKRKQQFYDQMIL